jgi:hypothetical protein
VVKARSFRSIRLPPQTHRILYFVLLAVVAVLYIAFGMQSLDKPGLYMDAVDPDYLVPRMIHPEAPTEFWMMPGNELFDRFPVLAGPYSGSFVAYLLVPFYLVLGGTLTAIRVAHLCIGLAILIATFVFLQKSTRSLAITTAFCAVLAVDPAFILLFRTQAYISIFPVIFVVFGFHTMYSRRSVGSYVGAGILFGLATFGYFIFGFLIPGLIVFCLIDSPRQDRKTLLLAVLGGIALGASPYALGYGLMFGALGFEGGINYLRSTVFQLNVNTGQPYFARLTSVVNWTWLMAVAAWDSITFWGDATIHRGQAAKVSLLLLLPLAALPLSFGTRDEARMYRLVGLSTLSYLLTSTVFGQRLGGHDLTPLLPLMYLLAGMSVAVMVASAPLRRHTRTIAALGAFATIAFLAFNATLTSAMTQRLGEYSAQGLFSSILSDYPKVAEAENDRTPHIFWQWGSLFQFIYLTDGKIPAHSSGGLQPALCQYGKAKIVLTGDEAMHHPDIDFPKLRAKVTGTQMLRDVYSGFPYEIISVAPVGSPCVPVVGSAPSDLHLPEGVIEDSSASYSGIYPSLPGQCCFLGRAATFSVHVLPGARDLRFEVYAPNFSRVASQRLTISIDGREVRRSATLAKGAMTWVDAPLPRESAGKPVVGVVIHPSSSFVPKTLDISNDTRTLSVILLRVVSANSVTGPGVSRQLRSSR